MLPSSRPMPVFTQRLPAAFLLLALIFLAAPAIAQSVVRGPYLQQPDVDSIIVRWRTDVPTDSRVQYAETGAIPFSSSDATLTVDHEIQLTGLSADTLYNYTVGTSTAVLAGGDINTGGDGQHFFTTAPAAAKDTRIWVIGDSGTADANAAAVRDAYLSYTGARGTDVWLMLGDNAYTGGNDTQYQAAVFDMYPQILRQVPVWSALGNHDAIDVAFFPPGAYMKLFSFPTSGEVGGVASGSENYYSFDYGNIHFISVDSSTVGNRAIGSPMLTWLAADLAANAKRWTIAFWHHPHYSKGSHDSDTESALLDMRQNVLPLLEAGGVDLVLTGHSHSYERSHLLDGHYGLSTTLTSAMVLDGGDGRESGDGAYVKPGPAGTTGEGAVHAVVGSSGKTEIGGTLAHPVMETSLLTLGSMVIDVNGGRLDAAFIDSTGAVLDEFTLIKDPPQVVGISVTPWSVDNEVFPASNNPLPVAILGASVASGDAADFDATQVDPASVRLGIGAAANVATPLVTDADTDGHADMLLAFPTMDSGIFCDDTEVSLSGVTLAGEEFVGTDAITTMDCDTGSCHPL